MIFISSGWTLYNISVKMGPLIFRPGLHDIGLLFRLDRFPDSGTKKRSGVWVFTRSLENSPVTLFRAKIISLRLPYLLFSLPICQAINQHYLHISHPIIKARFASVSYRIMILTHETKRYGLIFVPPADTEQSCTGLLEQSVSDSCRHV